MTENKIDIQRLTLSQATQEQKLKSVEHITDHWGTSDTGLDYFIRYHSTIESKNYTQDGRLTYWVLVPEDTKDTLDILSCCRTFRRDALILHANSDKPTEAIGYAVTTVVTPKKHRGQGYAKRMLSLLHHVLAPNVYPSPGIKIDVPPGVYPGILSVLYSDVGTYYERCGPVPGEIGWKVQNPISTIWKIPEVLPILSSEANTSSEIQLLSQDAVIELLSSDIPEWGTLPREPDTTYFAFSPSALPNTHLMTRSAIHPLHKSFPDVFWGARIASRNHFITWAFDYSSPHTLVITRINADTNTFPTLLLSAFQAGVSQNCQQAEVWNLPKNLLEEAERIGGATDERTSHLPAYRWYGPEPVKNIVWVRNEYYSWA